MTNTLSELRAILHQSIDTTSKRVGAFFKTAQGEYAAFDQFMGITTLTLRKIAKQFKNLNLSTIEQLFQSKFNEERLLAVIILVSQYQKLIPRQEEIYQFYLKNLDKINNWNLVDASAHHIMGAHLWQRKRNFLFDLANSNNLWQQRIAIVATWYFIKRCDFHCTINIASILLMSDQDLIHKAVGWMLREIGKKNQVVLTDFLDQHALSMPRVMLRYAIEKLPKAQRKNYLNIKEN